MREEEIPVLLKSMEIYYEGTGVPKGNHPAANAERRLSQNIVYLCRREAYTAEEIAEALGVPLLYIEDELEQLCKGENGDCGLMRKCGRDRYIANIILLEKKEALELLKDCEPETALLVKELEAYLQQKETQILELPYHRNRFDLSDILWTMIAQLSSELTHEWMPRRMREKYFSEIREAKQDYQLMGVVCREGEAEEFEQLLYGSDEAVAKHICGYKEVHFQNLYGKRIRAKYQPGEAVSGNPSMLLAVRSIKGLSTRELTEEEREEVEDAVAAGYLIRQENMLYPGIVTMTGEGMDAMKRMVQEVLEAHSERIEAMAEKIAEQVRCVVPGHLIPQYQIAAVFAENQIAGLMIEEGIRTGMIKEPGTVTGNEGTLLWFRE